MPVPYRRDGDRDQWEQVGPLLVRVLEGLGLYRQVREWKALQSWEETVGEKMAARSSPVRVQDGVLWLRVAGPHWAAEISLRKQDILAALNKEAGSEVLKDIRFVGAWDTRRPGAGEPGRKTSQEKPDSARNDE
jgi:predicted nucleic acid-binding Zn ribbon protein